MKKKQAEEYFNQLKKIDKGRNIKLADLINILTGGSISTKEYYQFIDYLASNQFGEYNYIDENIDKQDWRQISFAQVYQLLKSIRDYVLRNGTQDKLKDFSQIQGERVVSSSSIEDNSTLGLLNTFTLLENLPKLPQEQKSKQQKWKAYKIKVVKKLLIIFDFYRKSMCTQDQTFEKNQQLIQRFNINMFMKYFKDFTLSTAFELTKITKYFKKNAVNTIWLDFDRFVSMHLQLIGFKEDNTSQERYSKLKGLNGLLSSEKIKSMLNVRRQQAVAVIIEGHTGACKQDILKHIQEKSRERNERIALKWSHKSLKTQKSLERRRIATENRESPFRALKSLKSGGSAKRMKTDIPPSIYEQLKLPKLRLKQHRNESIYKSLKMLNLSQQQQRLKQMIDLNQNEQFLKQYIQQEARLKEKLKHRKKFELPIMRFS